MLGSHAAWIHEVLEQDKQEPKKQRHTAKRIFDRLKVERGYAGGYTTAKDAVQKWKATTKEVLVPLSHPPGEAQVDFGSAQRHSLRALTGRSGSSGACRLPAVPGAGVQGPVDHAGACQLAVTRAVRHQQRQRQHTQILFLELVPFKGGRSLLDRSPTPLPPSSKVPSCRSTEGRWALAEVRGCTAPSPAVIGGASAMVISRRRQRPSGCGRDRRRDRGAG